MKLYKSLPPSLDATTTVSIVLELVSPLNSPLFPPTMLCPMVKWIPRIRRY